MAQWASLEKRLGYVFKRSQLLKKALTHRSVSGSDNNERMEFLGDSILGCVMAGKVYDRFPRADEGTLSRLKSHLVCGDQLLIVGKALGLSDFLIVGPGEAKAGGHQRNSVVADAVEAILGAIYLDAGDNGMVEARECIERLFGSALESLTPEAALKDPKSRLQEWLQSQGAEVPVYEMLSVTGPDHNQCFTVACRLVVAGSEHVFNGSGRGRRGAEQDAASVAIAHFGI